MDRRCVRAPFLARQFCGMAKSPVVIRRTSVDRRGERPIKRESESRCGAHDRSPFAPRREGTQFARDTAGSDDHIARLEGSRGHPSITNPFLKAATASEQPCAPARYGS